MKFAEQFHTMQNVKAILPVIILWVLTTGTANGQYWKWAISGGSVNAEGTGLSCIDDQGNLYSTGQYSSPKFFIGGNSINVNGKNDTYLTKIDPTGKVLWLKGITSEGFPTGSVGDYPCDIHYCRDTKTILICGVLYGSNCKVSNCETGEGEFTYIARLDTNGNCLWTQTVIYNGGIYDADIEESDDGFIYLTSNSFYNCTINNVSFSPGAIISKFRSIDGSYIWAKKISTCFVANIIYHDKTLYLGGFSQQKDFTMGGMTIHGYQDDIYFANFDTSGTIKWARTYGGPGYDAGGRINMDTEGNIYSVGTFRNSAYFDSVKLTAYYLDDWFLLKTDKFGNVLWVKQGEILGRIQDQGISCIDKDGAIHSTGVVSGSMSFGNISIGTLVPWALFIAKFSPSGVCLGARSIQYELKPESIVCNQENDVLLLCHFYDWFQIYQTIITSIGDKDVAFLKFRWKPGTGGLGQPENDYTLSICSNPTTGLCTVKVPETLVNESRCGLQLMDMQGRMVEAAEVELAGGKIQIDLQQRAKGVYYMLLKGKDKVYKGKIVFY